MSSRSRSFFIVSLVAMALVVGACTSTDANKQQVANAAVDKDGLPVLTEEQKADGIICVRKPVTGSRISKKSCSTPEQRERAQSEAQRQALDVQRTSTSPTISE